MTDDPKRAKRPRDSNQLAKFIVDVATGEIENEAPEKAQGQRKGGLKGGKARAEKLSPEQRQAIAKKAAKTRWGGLRQRVLNTVDDIGHLFSTRQLRPLGTHCLP